jgi:AAA+ ATPase superfamily predicted ATPase
MFVGRKNELIELDRINRLNKASLVVVRGRRRIGKSTLIAQFSKNHSNFIEIQGLAPRESLTNEDQLSHFCESMSRELKLPSLPFKNWGDAFEFLAKQISDQKTLLFFDEISWMAQYDKDFVGHFKIAWDIHFKKCPQLMLVICGSVSSWIDKNILNGTGMMGRISLNLELKELELPLCNRFWRDKPVAAIDKLKMLTVTGGIPRYLEEIDSQRDAEQNISSLCFSPSGILFNEFNQIFKDIFSQRADIYHRIVTELVDQKLTQLELCQRLRIEKNGTFSSYLDDLEKSGFIARDYKFNLSSGKKSKLSRYRLKDNYLRFYLKVIEPKRASLISGALKANEVMSILPWDGLMGLQFENLVLNNLQQVVRHLEINPSTLVNASPYFQSKTLRVEATQVDLLIQCKNTIYICEIKFIQKITTKVIDDVRSIMNKLKTSPTTSLRPVLIYAGKLEKGVSDSDFFDHLISFETLLCE